MKNMRRFFTLFLMLFACGFLSAQESVVYEFYGNLTTNSGYRMPFYLKVMNPQANKYSGYTITNYKKEDQTKSSVKGTINLDTKTLSFHETGNLDTKSSADPSTFCYIHASNLKINVKEKSSTVTGTFVGKLPSGEQCAAGKVLLISTDNLKPKIQEVKQLKLPEVKKDTAANSTPKSANIVTEKDDSIFTANEVLELKNNKPTAYLQLWDGDMLDHDEVALYVNNKLYKSKILLQRNKQTISIPHPNTGVEIKIVALNQGTSEKNSLSFRFKDLNENKVYKSELKTNEFFKIKLKK